MNVGSLFSGVGGIDLGLERAGMRVVFQCERDEWCRGILAERWPGVPCYDDVRLVCRDGGRVVDGDATDAPGSGGWGPVELDLLTGGFPCQDLSVAGRRAGLIDGERSSLFFEFARIADDLVRDGGWVLIENVPGLLSSAEGRDFAVLLATLADIGFHDVAWRVLDSRYFGVPQRRRRVFIVGRRAVGDGAREVLLEPESGGGDHSKGGEAGPRVAKCLSRGSASPGVSAPGRRQEDDENLVHLVAHTLRAEGFDASEDGTGRGTPLISAALTVKDRSDAETESFVCAPADPDGVREAPGVPRRLDDPRPDGPRYSAMGNAVTVPVAEWIGCRIMEFEGSA